MGTIRERGGGKKPGELKSWQIRWEGPPGTDGMRKQHAETFKGNKRDALHRLAELETAAQSACYVEPNRITLSDYLDVWLADYASTKSVKTYERWESLINVHIRPALGHHQLGRIDPNFIARFYNHLRKEGRHDGKGGLSEQTVLHVHRCLFQALQQAVIWRKLDDNPAGRVQAPRPRRRRMDMPGEEGVNGLLSLIRETDQERGGTPVYLPTLLAFATGMRLGEVLGLRWCDVDLDAGRLVVRQSLSDTNKGLVFKETKTDRPRPVSITQALVDVLIRHKGEQAQERLLMGPAYRDHGLIVAHGDGSPCRPDALSKAFIARAKRAGLAGFTFHSLRHLHATQLVQSGVHMKIVSDRLGHSTIRLTMDRYTEFVPAQDREAAALMEDALRRATGG